MSTVATFERVYRMNNLFQGAKTIKNVFNRLELTLDIIILPNETPWLTKFKHFFMSEYVTYSDIENLGLP